MSSCKNCTERYIGCHSACESYANFKKERQVILDQMERERKLNNYFIPVQMKCADKANRMKQHFRRSGEES